MRRNLSLGFSVKKDKLKNGGIQTNACLEWNGKVDQIYLKFGLNTSISLASLSKPIFKEHENLTDTIPLCFAISFNFVLADSVNTKVGSPQAVKLNIFLRKKLKCHTSMRNLFMKRLLRV